MPDDRSQSLESYEADLHEVLGDLAHGWTAKPSSFVNGTMPARSVRRSTVTKELLRKRRLALVR